MSSLLIKERKFDSTAMPIDADLIERWRATADPAIDQCQGIVSRISDSCLKSLRDIIQHADPAWMPKSSTATLRKCYAMLTLWTDGHGVGDGRLDSLLERSTEIRQVTFEVILPLLKVLLQGVLKFVLPSTSDAQLVRRHAVASELYIQTRWLILRADESAGDSEDEDQSEDAPSDVEVTCQKARAKMMVGRIRTYTNCLVAMGTALDCPAPDNEHADKTGPLSGKQRCASDYHADLLKAKYPHADDLLVHQLGQRSWERYERMQRERELNANKEVVSELSNKSHAAVSEFQDSGLGTSLPPPGSCYAPTIVSARSFISSVTGGRGIEIPALSIEARKGAFFDCSACGRSIRAISDHEWRKHLYADLCPYSCIFPKCDFSTGSSMDWKLWGEHLDRHHEKAICCPLCLESTDKGKASIILHIARHMEEIALVALPRDVDSDAESDSGSSKGSGVVNSCTQSPNTISRDPQNDCVDNGSVMVKPLSDLAKPDTNLATISEETLINSSQASTLHDQGDKNFTINSDLDQSIKEARERYGLNTDSTKEALRNTADQIVQPSQTRTAKDQTLGNSPSVSNNGVFLTASNSNQLQDELFQNIKNRRVGVRNLGFSLDDIISSATTSAEKPKTERRGRPWSFDVTSKDHVVGFILSDRRFRCSAPDCIDLAFGRHADFRRHIQYAHGGCDADPYPRRAMNGKNLEPTIKHDEASESGSHEIRSGLTVSSATYNDMIKGHPGYGNAKDDTIIGLVDVSGKFACSEPGCNDLRFGRQADFLRHHKFLHSFAKEEFFCPWNGCPRSRKPPDGKTGRSFGGRKDKMEMHVASVHGYDAQTAPSMIPENPVDQGADLQSHDDCITSLGVITKTPYVRPPHPKLKCQFCEERPEGFRGTAELDRHVARAHASFRKGYICIDNSPAKDFLADCKHCLGKKVYGAYYNAAAHLRRAHFHPRKRGRKGKDDHKRGGIGGGDHPPMDVLKEHWIKEIEIPNVAPTVPPISSDSEAELIQNFHEQDPQVLMPNWGPKWQCAEEPPAEGGGGERLAVLTDLGGQEISHGVLD